MKQITKDWERITGLVRRIQYLTINQYFDEKKESIDLLGYKLKKYYEDYQKPYNPADPE